MSKDQPYSLDHIAPAGTNVYMHAPYFMLPTVIQALLSSHSGEVLHTLAINGMLIKPLQELKDYFLSKGGRLIMESEIEYVFIWKDSYVDVHVSKKDTGISISGCLLDANLHGIEKDLERDFISRNKTNLVFTIIKNPDNSLDIRNMGDGSSPLIKDNYLPEVLEDIDFVIKSFQKKPPAGRICILNGDPGCHRKGQKLLMFDGSLKSVEDIVVGDQLMGPDSTSRKVLSLCRGKEEMVEIMPIKGTPWVVNKSHILSVVRSGNHHSEKDGTITDVKVSDWMSWNKTNKAKNKLFRVPVIFATKGNLPIDPYVLGALIGDGSLHEATPSLISTDQEVIPALKVAAKKFGLSVHYRQYGSRCPSYSICYDDGGKRSRPNPFMLALKKLGLNVICDDKFIPYKYKVSSIKNRLRLLAGLLDTDGHFTHGVFEFSTKSKKLSDDVAFVARSLGFSAYPQECNKSDQYGTVGTYYRMCISGDIDRIPTKIKRKVAPKRKQIKSVLRTGFSVRPLPAEEYYGFTLTGDGRYLLDDFTVTHNTGKTHLIRSILMRLDCVFLIVPSNMIDSLDKPEFMPLLLDIKDNHEKPIIMIIEDGDICLVPRKNDNISSITSLLNLSDGILGTIMDIKMIISTNADIEEMDQAILRPGRLCKNIHVGSLEYEQANRVYRRLMQKEDVSLDYRKRYTLAEIYDIFNNIDLENASKSQVKQVIGFGMPLQESPDRTLNSAKKIGF
jgi:hypothetical protein